MNTHSHAEYRERTLDIFVRSLAPGGYHAQQETILDRVAQLETDGAIAEYSLFVWGKQVGLTSTAAQTEPGQFIHDRVSEFQDWARRNAVSLNSFFPTKEVCSRLAGEEYTALVLPAIALAEYRGDDLWRVAPCADGNLAYTVDDLLDIIETETAHADQDAVAGPPQFGHIRNG